MARITSLHIYPVKSCRGIDVNEVLITPTGLEWDRRWMIVRPTGRFVTQREYPKLATIAVAIGNGRLTLSAEGHPPLVVDVAHGGPARRRYASGTTPALASTPATRPPPGSSAC